MLALHGWQAVRDGGLRQLIELLVTGYASMACHVVLKACQYSLVSPRCKGETVLLSTRSSLYVRPAINTE